MDIREGPPCRKEIERRYRKESTCMPDSPCVSNVLNTDVTVKDSRGSARSVCCLKIYSKRSYERTNWPPVVDAIDIVFALIGLSIFVFDYITDVKLAVDYLTDGEYKLFYLTVCFIAVPSFISGIISMIWYKMAHNRDTRTGYDQCTKPLFCCRRPLSFLKLCRIGR